MITFEEYCLAMLEKKRKRQTEEPSPIDDAKPENVQPKQLGEN